MMLKMGSFDRNLWQSGSMAFQTDGAETKISQYPAARRSEAEAIPCGAAGMEMRLSLRSDIVASCKNVSRFYSRNGGHRTRKRTPLDHSTIQPIDLRIAASPAGSLYRRLPGISLKRG
jgi:hypothetical protein